MCNWCLCRIDLLKSHQSAHLSSLDPTERWHLLHIFPSLFFSVTLLFSTLSFTYLSWLSESFSSSLCIFFSCISLFFYLASISISVFMYEFFCSLFDCHSISEELLSLCVSLSLLVCLPICLSAYLFSTSLCSSCCEWLCVCASVSFFAYPFLYACFLSCSHFLRPPFLLFISPTFPCFF